MLKTVTDMTMASMKSNRKPPMGYWVAPWPWMALNRPSSRSLELQSNILITLYGMHYNVVWNALGRYTFHRTYLLFVRYHCTSLSNKWSVHFHDFDNHITLKIVFSLPVSAAYQRSVIHMSKRSGLLRPNDVSRLDFIFYLWTFFCHAPS